MYIDEGKINRKKKMILVLQRKNKQLILAWVSFLNTDSLKLICRYFIIQSNVVVVLKTTVFCSLPNNVLSNLKAKLSAKCCE